MILIIRMLGLVVVRLLLVLVSVLHVLVIIIVRGVQIQTIL